MNSKKTIKQILVALGVAVLALALYAVFSGGFSASPKDQGGLVSVKGKSLEGQIREDDVNVTNTKILKVLQSVKNIQLDDQIFSNPVFRSLKDTRFTLPRPVQIGRPNPFASIGSEFITETENDSYTNGEGGSVESLSFFDNTDTTTPSRGETGSFTSQSS